MLWTCGHWSVAEIAVSAVSSYLHYSRNLYCTTLMLAQNSTIHEILLFFSFFFPLWKNSISHNPQSHTFCIKVFSAASEALFFSFSVVWNWKSVFSGEIPHALWVLRLRSKSIVWSIKNIFNHLQCKLAPMIHTSQNPPHHSSLLFPWYLWGMPGCGSDETVMKNRNGLTRCQKKK